MVNSDYQFAKGFPRTRGDRPSLMGMVAAPWRVPPHKWAVGTTFEWEFEFPMPTNPIYGRESEPKPKTKKPAHPKAKSTRAPNTSKPAATKPAKPKPSKKPKRTCLTVEERRERARARAVETRSKLKESGLCRDCRQPAIPGQTRCPDCAEQHRKSRQPRQSKSNHRDGSTAQSATKLKPPFPSEPTEDGDSKQPKSSNILPRPTIS